MSSIFLLKAIIPGQIQPCSTARLFSTTSIAWSKRQALRKPGVSTLAKHLNPSRLNGRERRNQIRQQLEINKPKSSKGPYIPVKKRLETIQTTVAPATLPPNTSSGQSRHGNKEPSVLQDTKQIKTKQLSAILASRTFDDLQLSETSIAAVKNVLEHVGDSLKPTEIQALAIPELLDRKKRHVLVAAETGSGKTFAYLLPTIDLLKDDERKYGAEKLRRLDHPRAIVLVPTRELVQQVVKSCKSLSHVAKIRSLGLEGRTSKAKIAKRLADGPVDILVTTPTTLLSSVEDKVLSMADARYLIIDEADSLFDAGWGEDCRQIIKTVQQIAEKKQNQPEKIMVVSATLPRSVHTALDALFPKMIKLTTPSLHKALPNLKQSFVDLERFQGNRQMALLEVLKKNIKKDDKTLVFCNTKKSVEILHRFLGTKNINALALYKDAPMSRAEALEIFSQPIDAMITSNSYMDNDSNKIQQEGERKKTFDQNILISTDIASRGIDTTFVDHVILYDFPTSVVDYLHRVGRTARAGQTGKATSLIGRKDRMIADRIKRSIREGTVMT